MKSSSRVVAVVTGIALALAPALVFTPQAAVAVSIKADDKADFIASVASAAQKAQRTYGIPASVLMAEAIENSSWGTSKVATKADNYFNTRCSATMTAKQFAALADDQVGKPYVLGAEASYSDDDPPRFDCSELVEWLFARSGNPITDLAASQYNVTESIGSKAPKAGDLVFLRNNPARSNGIGHVAVLTKKLDNGDWRIIEARGRDYGVVRTTLSYWKKRSYFAGVRRYSKLVFAGQDGVVLSATRSSFQSGCVAITSGDSTIKYRNYTSLANSFLDRASEIAAGSEYKAARAAISDIPSYIKELAQATRPDDASAYAKTLQGLVDDYQLTDYDVVPFTLVLDAGDTGAKVTALQYLLLAEGKSVKVSGTFDSATVKAVKSFQSGNKLTADGEAGPKTFTAMLTQLKSGATGDRVRAAHTLLTSLGYPTNSGATLGKTSVASVKAFQEASGLSATGTVTTNTWAKLFMSLDGVVPAINGTATVDQNLTVKAGSWGPGKVELSYQWLRDGDAINKATSTTYALQPADAGARITVKVTGTKTSYTPTTLTSAATAEVARATLTATPTPTITGTAKVGQTLAVTAGTWAPGTVALSYQWNRDGKAISMATDATYQVQDSDVDATLTVTVTGSRDGYTSVSKTSAKTAKVTQTTFRTTPKPKITGKSAVGATLKAATGSWSPQATSFTYQWYRDGKAIDDATGASYTVALDDLGARLSVEAVGSRDGYVSATVTSAVTAKVAKGTLTRSPKPTITGKAKVGRKLTAKTGTWAPGEVSLSYQWYRGPKKLSGATRATYTVRQADRGHTVIVRVRGVSDGYNAVTRKASAKIA